MSELPSVSEFRALVDGIPTKKHRELIKTLWLTGCRVNELMMKTAPSRQDPRKPFHTRPLGAAITHSIEEYWELDEQGRRVNMKPEHALVLKMGVLKRKARGKKRIEREGKQVWRYIGLPCNPKYEPWTLDIMRWITAHQGALRFNVTDRTVLRIVKRSFQKTLPYMTTHTIRSFRVSHLLNFYKLSPVEICQFIGWTFKAALGKNIGQLDIYGRHRWRSYFAKLLKPVDQDATVLSVSQMA